MNAAAYLADSGNEAGRRCRDQVVHRFISRCKFSMAQPKADGQGKIGAS